MKALNFFRYWLGFIRISIGEFVRQSKELPQRYPQYRIGRGCYGPLKIETFGDRATVTIGAFCSFAKGVTILLGGEHRADWVTTYPFDRKYIRAKDVPHSSFARGDVIIGNDVWIGRDALILSGTTIGNGAIIGARSVVRGTVPPYAIVAGTPAKVLRPRFSPEVVAELQRICWWNWTDENIRCELAVLMKEPDLELLRKYGS
jgi:acetyltransferase-like isoleucine patch superfamily enzyme